MPVPTPGSTILVTGASGFIAAQCVQHLLEAGYKVVGTVRSADKGEYLEKLFAGKPFKYTIVKDIQDPDAFAEAVVGVEGVLHTASPFYMLPEGGDPQELISPAVKGTTGILTSALKAQDTIKRIVITSSVAAVNVPAPPPFTLTEEHWNTDSVEKVEKLGAKAIPSDKYRASKALAERAAWKFVEENKPSWDIATINPPFVFGPIIHYVSSPESLNTSVAQFYKTMKGEMTEDKLPGPVGNFVDVRDVALAHVRALTVPEASGKRFIISNGPYCTQDFTDALNKLYPNLPNIPHGKPGAAAEVNDPKNAVVSSGKRAQDVLGIKYTSIEDCVKGMYESIKAKGW